MLEMCNISLNSLLTKNKEYVVFELRRLFLEVLGIVLNDMWCHKQKPSGCRFCEPLTNPCAGVIFIFFLFEELNGICSLYKIMCYGSWANWRTNYKRNWSWYTCNGLKVEQNLFLLCIQISI
ncbi:hypothetical protein HanXRQr2_Chr13g0581971 [Helianthus annuus]|uniref:Uncharacterized protein n=1 Tax=Helianthus annuus TaxID=4232 RepID=A0A9K3HB55_HELAN|nr:uncharacterized protein LOC110898157 isoform X1 [Helianthus annuus]XP_022000602.1 uncharacterized protein LOC110898157 isoform X1 [Helianthus annuus]XP_022000603.1 uncharacterized protein LOC110898157 isoform X1 [Helianthus annuus]KAF5772841.1 hypothetical protein HanXRQr2_Chr13g0581971 [Helianthus annuus]KAJ0476415.1 hypothetical protein HanHA300_Chr13g0477161 [Helianthus annuus]KAJ0497237.1 hypothetical protein HanHA89_Chr13g0509221 [Helianthus annuus]KAJ0663246.1 hypothetical protein Ha